MAQPVDDNQTMTTENAARPRNVGAVLGLVAAGVLIVGGGYYAYSSRSVMESRLADLDQRKLDQPKPRRTQKRNRSPIA